MLSPLGAGALALLALWFSWRSLQRCRTIERGSARPDQRAGAGEADGAEPDPFERELLERELNLELGLAKRNVQAARRAALFAGTALSFWALTGGRVYDPVLAGEAFVVGLLGWVACGELLRRIGSAADNWRTATNQKRRRQGVDQP